MGSTPSRRAAHCLRIFLCVSVDMKKVCCRCGDEKLIDDFGVNRSRKDGRNPSCKECHRKYTDKHYDENKPAYVEGAMRRTANKRAKMRDYLNEEKSKPCADCKRPYPPYVMDFDHVRDLKCFEVSASLRLGVSMDRLIAEVAKCDVVCANCHRERSHQRMSAPIAQSG